MGLYDKPKGGDFIPYVKYNAKAGRWYVKGDNGEKEIVNPTFAIDFKNVKKVYALFQEGQAPDIVEFPDFNSVIESPSPKHKLGIRVNMFSKDSFGGVVEFVSTAANACGPISDLYNKWEANGKNEEAIVVKVTGVNPVSGKHGTNYEPMFEVVKFIPRPKEFDTAVVNDNQQAPPPAQATNSNEF